MRILLLLLAWGAIEPAVAGGREATSGLLNLVEHDFDRKVVQLRGEWEFYWARLLTPEDFRGPDPPVPDGYVRVPGVWNALTVDGRPVGARGYGTYRLLIQLPSQGGPGGSGGHSGEHPLTERSLAIHVPWAFSAYALWINGVPAARNGSVGTASELMTPQFLPVTAPVPARHETLELIVQVSNFHHRNGGLWNTPLLGSHELLARRQAGRLAADAVLAGAILFMGIYHLVIFAWFKERRASLYLGVSCLVVALRTAVTGEHLLDQITGGMPWELELRLEYLTGYGVLAFSCAFLRSLFPAETPRPFAYAAYVVTGLGSLITVFASTYAASLLIPYYLAVASLFLVASAGTFIAAAVRRREGARLLLGGGIALTVAVYHDMFHYNLMGINMRLLPLGQFVLLLFQSMALGRRFALAFRREAALSAENAALLKTVRAQLEEVRRSRRIIAAADEELRKSIAERLHGRVQTRLLAVWHRLGLLREALPPEAAAAREPLEELLREIDQVREVEIRQVSHLLHPSIVRVGLIPAAESLLRQFQGSFDLHLEVDDQVKAWDDPARGEIPERVRLVAYRVLEDALGNVQKHAMARRVTVRIAAVPGERALRLVVTDDGRGFDRATLEPKLGLSAVAARVSTVGGRWDIESHPDAGTTISVELPLSLPAAAPDEDAAVRDPATGLLARASFESMLGSLLQQAEIGEPGPKGAQRERAELRGAGLEQPGLKRGGFIRTGLKRARQARADEAPPERGGLVFVAVDGAREAHRGGRGELADKMMQSAADAVKRSLPPQGIAFRYDAATIVALLPESQGREIRECARAIRAALRSAERNGGLPLRARAGTAAYPSDAAEPRALVERAASNASGSEGPSGIGRREKIEKAT